MKNKLWLNAFKTQKNKIIIINLPLKKKYWKVVASPTGFEPVLPP